MDCLRFDLYDFWILFPMFVVDAEFTFAVSEACEVTPGLECTFGG